MIGASSRASKSLLRSLRAKHGTDAFYAVEVVRSDSGFFGMSGNALLAPIGAFNSPAAVAALSTASEGAAGGAA